MSTPSGSSKTYYGEGKFIAKVTNVMDPKESGRCQVRMMGAQGNETTIPDANLNWAHIVSDASNPNQNGVGSSGLGLLKDSEVLCEYINGVPMIVGTWPAAESKDGQKASGKGGNDLPPNARTEKTEGGDFRLAKRSDDGNPPEYSDKSLIWYASHEAKRPDAYGGEAPAKEGINVEQSFTIGTLAFA